MKVTQLLEDIVTLEVVDDTGFAENVKKHGITAKKITDADKAPGAGDVYHLSGPKSALMSYLVDYMGGDTKEAQTYYTSNLVK